MTTRFWSWRKILVLVAVAAGLWILAPAALGADQSPQQVVTAYMEALKARDYLGALRMAGIEVPPMVAMQIEVGLMQQTYVQLGVKSYAIKKVQVDGGLAQVTVEEVRFFDVNPDIRGAIAQGMGKAAESVRWGDNRVSETFVLVRLDKRWQFDTGHSGVRLDHLPIKELMEAGMERRVADQAVLTRVADFINTIGIGQCVQSVGSMGSVAPAIAAILIPNFIRAKSQGQLTACKSNLKNIGTAMEMYSTDNSGRFPTSIGALTPTYLLRIPTCPAAGQDTYARGFASASNPDAYTIMCSGHHHGQVGQGPDYPQYTSTQGLISQ